jgi:RHS repeat-associated protein
MSCLQEIGQLSMTDRRVVASLWRRASRSRMAKWGCRIIVSLVAVTSAPMFASQLVVNVTSVNQNGTDQSASGLWDSGVVTVTVNGRAESVPYGQFSTTAAIASGIAARFSLDCNSPVTAKASGNAITFVEKSPNGTDIQLNAAIEWNSSTFSQASFEVPMDGPPSQLPGGPYSVSLPIKCTPNPVPNGMSAVCSTQMPPGLQVEPTGTVAFQLDGGSVWSVANVDNTGLAISDGLSSVAQGAHTVTATYSGDANYLGTSDTFSPLDGQSSSTVQPATLYSYNITSYQVNGNLLSYNDSVNGSWTLGYDNLNRLTSSSQTPVGSMTQYGCWSYDSFGNRMNQTIASQPPTPVSCTAPQGSTPYGVTTISYVPGTNQIGTGSWRNAQGIFTPDGAPAYDSAGHMISMPGDPVNPYTGAVNTYMYDPDGHICAALLPSGALEGYLYNAEGQRVAKGTLTSFTCDAATNGFQVQTTANGSVVQPNVQEIYIIGPDGSEMTGLDGAGNWSHVNVSAVGQMIATYTNDGMGVHFQLADWLGTHRVQTDYLGQVEGSCQSQPFGDGMTCFGGVASDHKFTGKERDTESGLDYFGARYYASNMGRWMSPDPSGLALSDLGNPQSLNLYSYVINNPAILVDPDGLCYGQQQSSVWSCIGGFFKSLFGGGDSSDSSQSSGSGSSSSQPSGTSNESIDVTIRWSTPMMQPGVNYGDPHGPKGNNVGGCPLGTCHTLDGLYPPYNRGSFDGGLAMMGILGAGFGVSPFSKAPTGPTYEEGVAAAQARYPAKAGKIEMHHIAPKYLGGDPFGPTVPLDGAYHQMITNEFRNAVPYGTGPIPPDELHQLMQKVYATFPLPPGS